MRVLITGAGGPAGTAVVEHLRGGHHWTLAVDVDADTAGSRLANDRAQVPPAVHPDFAAELVSLVRKHRIDVVLCTVAEEMRPLLAVTQQIQLAGARVLLPPAEAVRVCEDKLAFARFAERVAAPVAPTSAPGEQLPPGPWVVKPRQGRGSRGVYRCDSVDEVRRRLAEDPSAIVQSALPGQEFTVDALADARGRVVVCVPRWRQQTRGGISSQGESFRHPELEAAVTALLTALDYRGPANVQGCCAEDGSFAFFEVNPRFSGGLPITVAAGADLVEAYLRLAAGHELSPDLVSWQAGVSVMRYLTQAPALPPSSPESTGPATAPASDAGVRRRSILVPLGTRPEIIKLASVITALGQHHDVRVVFTGQHDIAALGADMLAEFGLVPTEIWRLPADPTQRLAELVSKAARCLREHRPDTVLVLGDTHTVPAFCLAGSETGTPVIHLEAGLRSYNPLSREEMNRRIAGSTARLHLAPTERAAAVLRSENVPAERIAVVGNPALDELRRRDVTPTPWQQRAGLLITAHRPTTVDNEERLAELVRVVEKLSAGGHSVRFPLHPRTENRLNQYGLMDSLLATGAEISGPLAYRELVTVLRDCVAVVTDSGGLQEEAAWVGVPAVVLRGSTPRWEGIESGFAVLCELDAGSVSDAVYTMTQPGRLEALADTPCPFGDGHTAARVAELLGQVSTWDKLVLTEPSWIGRGVPLP